jgi:hypothetical protein
MSSILLLHHYEARKHATAASCFMKPGWRREIPEGRGRGAKLRCSELVTLLALSALVFLACGSVAQAQEISPPILSSGLRDTTPVRKQAIERLRQHTPTESPLASSNLPPIESIGTGSNIRPFLASGVPADLTRAALRRAWSTDPAIRDFIGLSENSWDFNAPDGIPGFGSLTTDGPRRLLARVTGETESLDPERLAAERLTSK